MLEGMDADMRAIEVEEIEAVKVNAEQIEGLRIEMLDVTKLSLMRPDRMVIRGLTCIRFRLRMGFESACRTIASGDSSD